MSSDSGVPNAKINPPSPGPNFPHPTQHLDPQPRRRLIIPALVALWQFFRATITLPFWFFRGRRQMTDEITVYSAHPSFFLWMPVLMGFVLSSIAYHYPDTVGVTGWIYVWVLIYFMATLLYDFSTRKLLLWVGIFMLIWLAAAYIEHLRRIVLLGHIFTYLNDLKPKLDPGMATVLSWILLFPWLGSIILMVLNGRKRFTPNEIGEFHFGEGCELTDRTGLRFRTQYRDVLEAILTFGGGDLLAVDNHHNVIKRWDNIVGLFFVWNDLDRILHQRAALIENDEETTEKAKQNAV